MIAQTIDEIEAILGEETEVLGNLVDCLKAERLSIVAYDLKAITETCQIKNQNLIRIKTIEASRRELLKKLGLPLEKALASISRVQAERVRQRLAHVRSMAQMVREFNEIQKRYVAYSLYNVQASLALMEALQGKGSVRCYDERGAMSSQGSPHSISSSEARVMSRSV